MRNDNASMGSRWERHLVNLSQIKLSDRWNPKIAGTTRWRWVPFVLLPPMTMNKLYRHWDDVYDFEFAMVVTVEERQAHVPLCQSRPGFAAQEQNWVTEPRKSDWDCWVLNVERWALTNALMQSEPGSIAYCILHKTLRENPYLSGKLPATYMYALTTNGYVV